MSRAVRVLLILVEAQGFGVICNGSPVAHKAPFFCFD